MRERFFRGLAKAVTRHNKTVLILCALFTVAMVIAAGRLGMKTQISDMLPGDIPQIQEFNNIIEEFSSASTAILSIESKKKDTKRMKECADDLANRLRDLQHYVPKKDQKLGLAKKIKMLTGEFPIKGIEYDTINLVRRIDSKIDNKFFAEHGLMMQKPEDMDNMTDMFGSLDLAGVIKNINDNFEKEYVEDSENLNSLDGEDQAIQGLDGMYKFVNSMGKYIQSGDSTEARKAVEAFVSGPEYMISSDNSMLLVMLQPAISWNDMETMLNLAYQVYDTIMVIREEYPDLDIGYSGSLMLQIDETEAMKKDFGWPSLVALILILMLLIGSFRTWRNPFFSVAVLITGIIWVSGALALILQYLNMMSASFGIILIGLGIDFGIHFISGFRDGRDQGMSIEDSIHYMYQKVGSGVITGGLTTAFVFYGMALARFKAYTEMGISIGTGIVVIMGAMFVLLPALIVWDNKGYSVVGNLFRKLHLGFIPTAWSALGRVFMLIFRIPVFGWITNLMQFRFLEYWGRMLTKVPPAIVIIIVSAVLVVMSIQGARNIEFEYDMMKLEPEGITSVVVQDKIVERFEIAPDYAMLTADNLEDCRDKIEQLKKAGNRTGLIGRVDGITEFLPDENQQQENVEKIETFRKKIEKMPAPGRFGDKDMNSVVSELKRLHQNIVEIGELSIMGSGENNKVVRKCDELVGKKDKDSKILTLASLLQNAESGENALDQYQQIMAPTLRERLIRMTNTDPITIDSLPKDIRDRYVTAKSKKLLITIYPKAQIFEERNLRNFNKVTWNISERTTGMPALMMIMIDYMSKKGRTAILVGAIAILIILLIDFQSISYTLLAIVPLAAGALWMVGLMALTGMKYNMVNFMALPLIIGIGIDDGVHILHRYRIEGRGSIPTVLKFTGRAILLTSLTTMIGFGSMGLASHRGLASFGRVLFMGVGSCFLSSALLLPAIITLKEKLFKGKKK